ncbi:MAG TPA: AMP-binding protein, partial [Candidatus Polarisedimenticolia bacterium]|nr:AMP-binding protein [Candidatus Polarisedimenticolia bacterium]
DRRVAGHGSGNLESLILGRSDASGDLSMVERIDRAARLLDRHDKEGRGTEQAGLLRAIAARLDLLKSQVEKVVVLRRLGTRGESGRVEGRDISWDDFLAAGEAAAAGAANGSVEAGAAAFGPAPEPMGAEDPLFVMFTSGSTGKPKGLVHTHGGYLARLPFLLRTLFGLGRDQRILTVADPGWITGQSFVGWGPLVYGMTSVLVGFVPTEDRLWAAVERYRVNFLKTGVTGIRAAMGDDPEHIRSHDLSSLRHRAGEATLAEIQRAIEARGLARLSYCMRAAYLAHWSGRPSDWPRLFEAGLAVARREGGNGSNETGAAADLDDAAIAPLREEVRRLAAEALLDARRYTSCSCAEPLDAAVQAWWEAHIGPMENCWWRTEDSGPETGATPGAYPQTPNAAARPLPWADLGVFVIHDEEGNQVAARRAATGEKGTVFVRGNPGIARGTWTRGGDWRDDARFRDIYHTAVPGWHNTGDAGVVNPDGTLTFLGRDDEVLNVSGHRVGTQEIEGAVRGHPAVANVAAIGIPAEVRGDNPVLFVKLREGHETGGLLDNQIRDAVTEAKGSHVAPTTDDIFYVPSLPTTKSGKILRRFLKYAAALDRDRLADILLRLQDRRLRAGLVSADRETLMALFPALLRQGRTIRLGSVATVDQMGVLIDILMAVARRRELPIAMADPGAESGGAKGTAGQAAGGAEALAYRPFSARPEEIHRLGRTDFRPGVDPLPLAQEAWAMTRDPFGHPVHGDPVKALVRVVEPVPR